MTEDEPLSVWDRAMADHDAALVKGARVRIMPGEGCHHHGEQEAGLTGVIIGTGRPSLAHRYVVLFDRPLWITVSAIHTWEYAAAELTVIPWRTPEEVVADTLARLKRPGDQPTRP